MVRAARAAQTNLALRAADSVVLTRQVQACVVCVRVCVYDFPCILPPLTRHLALNCLARAEQSRAEQSGAEQSSANRAGQRSERAEKAEFLRINASVW